MQFEAIFQTHNIEHAHLFVVDLTKLFELATLNLYVFPKQKVMIYAYFADFDAEFSGTLQQIVDYYAMDVINLTSLPLEKRKVVEAELATAPMGFSGNYKVDEAFEVIRGYWV